MKRKEMPMPEIEIRGTTLHYQERGRGTALLLLHGFPLDLRMWRQQLDDLSSNHRVIAMDLRGFGRSRSTESFTIDSLADDVAAFIEQLSLRACVVGGLSMGGYVLQSLALRRPELLRGMILIDTRAEGDDATGKANRQKMIDLVRLQGPKPIADQMLPKLLAEGAAEPRPQLVTEVRAMAEACPARTIEHALIALRDRADRIADLPSISLPTLILVGELDAITPPAQAQNMHRAINGSKLIVIPNAGHMAPLEQPEPVNAAIRELIQKI